MKYWVYLEGRQQGPFEFEQLYDLPIDKNTKVWFDGLPRWCAAGEVEQLACLFDGSPRPQVVTKTDEKPADTDEVVDEVITEVCEKPEGHEADGMHRHDHVQPQPVFVAGAGVRRHELPEEPCPPTYLGWSIALAICCCSPISIGALVASICVSSFYQGGNIHKARRASEWAAWLIMISIALGFLPMMLLSVIS